MVGLVSSRCDDRSPPAGPLRFPAVTELRHDWTVDQATALLTEAFHDLLARAQAEHRSRFDASTVEGAMLLSIKTGGCPEDCAYCPQSAKWATGVEAQRLMEVDEIVAAARK